MLYLIIIKKILRQEKFMKKLLSFVLVLFISSFVYADSPKNAKGDDIANISQQHKQQMEQDFDNLIKELKINETQQKEIKDLMQNEMTRKRELRHQIRAKISAIDNELLKEKFDMEVIKGFEKEIQELNTQITRINIETKLKVRGILTFEQYTKIEQNRKQAMEKFKKGRK